MKINASTVVTLQGEQYVHGYLAHNFQQQQQQQQQQQAQLQLRASARQFSAYPLLLGRMESAERFDLQHAVIVQDKAELCIPLTTEVIPSAKEFREAIQSLSNEQQAFAQAFRAMQLQSTLFALLIVQIKAPLEQVLYLPRESLMKEIELTQRLLKLMIEYQISSDLLCYDENNNENNNGNGRSISAAAEKVNAVRSNAKKMHDLIEDRKQEELKDKNMQKLYYSSSIPYSYSSASKLLLLLRFV
jgi:hypothetical protein